jgi:hypothetical protein
MNIIRCINAYAIGCVEYDRNNQNYDCWNSVVDEAQELREAFKSLSVRNSLMEFFDLVHAIIEFLAVKYLPKQIFMNYGFWLVVFPLIIPCALKMGRRYLSNGCIRNHQRANPSHKCPFNDCLKH